MRLLYDNVDGAEVFVAGILQLAPDVDTQHLCSNVSAGLPTSDGAAASRRRLLQDGDEYDVTPPPAGTTPDNALDSGALQRHQLGMRNSLLDGAVPPHAVVRAEGAQHPTHAVTVFPPPISFANDPRLAKALDEEDDNADGGDGKPSKRKPGKRRFRMDRKFGEWHTAFQLPPGSRNGAPHATAADQDAYALQVARATYPQVAKPAPPAFYAVFPGGSFVTDGNVVTCNKAYTTGGCMWDFKLFGSASPGHRLPATHRHGTIVALCDFWCKGYFHFTHEHLPRLALVDHILRADKSAKVTVPRSTGFVRAYLLDVLGYDESQLISVSSTYQATQKAVYPQPQRCGSIFPQTLLMLRRLVFERLGGLPHTICDAFPENDAAYDGVVIGVGKDDASPADSNRALLRLPLVVWAERKKLSRMPKNYYEIRTAVETQFAGRAVFRDTNGLGVAAQIRLFNRASVIVGPHGANLANVMWARHGAYAVEFMSHRYANMCYYGTAARLGVRFGAIFHGALKHGAYNSSAAEVAMHVEEGLRAVGRDNGGRCV